MEGKELEEALKHDQAQKAAAQEQAASEEAAAGEQPAISVSYDLVIRQLEQKEALLAKTVTLALLDVARTLASRALGESKVRMVNGEQQVEAIRSAPEKAVKLLEAAMLAVNAAAAVDILGDKAIVRGGIAASHEAKK